MIDETYCNIKLYNIKKIEKDNNKVIIHLLNPHNDVFDLHEFIKDLIEFQYPYDKNIQSIDKINEAVNTLIKIYTISKRDIQTHIHKTLNTINDYIKIGVHTRIRYLYVLYLISKLNKTLNIIDKDKLRTTIGNYFKKIMNLKDFDYMEYTDIQTFLNIIEKLIIENSIDMDIEKTKNIMLYKTLKYNITSYLNLYYYSEKDIHSIENDIEKCIEINKKDVVEKVCNDKDIIDKINEFTNDSYLYYYFRDIRDYPSVKVLKGLMILSVIYKYLNTNNRKTFDTMINNHKKEFIKSIKRRLRTQHKEEMIKISELINDNELKKYIMLYEISNDK